MKVVLDINVLLVSIPKKSKYRTIFDALINGYFHTVISNDILSEYVEILEQKTNFLVASNIAELLLNLKNVEKVDIYFEWKLILSDLDDNKYVDAYVCSNADYIITNDHHFKILKQIEFPKVIF
ncbi:putative toxin-antitoxin system toxin component, PIN family [Pedobacter sp. ISL-68]|uniref:putative toxin-antitoxin system toxin component, PIN family n=1 Tax=unclassified Pedobacter TaxID=2628915 RepID=UPI001BEA4524|nr:MULTISPECIES: putative toxin-antitoxin system toxin component, PIN family [unclassified Pedobacter]MBT2560422.1 putative toxin-antitoxin system toxin component, PIN family [Pedobacter sp. ISL-64]MBT2589402.1 putative toxin-antitoxin system toxin component, PIN family [Pedobacter sp. ISL-68]